MEAFCKRYPDAEEHGWIAPGVSGAQPVRLRTTLTPESVSAQSSAVLTPGRGPTSMISSSSQDSWHALYRSNAGRVNSLGHEAVPCSGAHSLCSALPHQVLGAAHSGFCSDEHMQQPLKCHATHHRVRAQAELDAEHWCSVLQEVALPGTGTDPAAFMAKAVDFVNQRCEGTLSCSIFIPPQVG